MSDQNAQQNDRDPSALTKHDRPERQEPQEQESEVATIARPVAKVTAGRRPLFRS